MNGQILTFTNLFPSSVRPTHGLFVQERMRRVITRTGLRWQVIAPVPGAPWGLRNAEARLQARLPAQEVIDGVRVHHPRYLHLPGLSLRFQAQRMARAALPLVASLMDDHTVLDAHYVYPDGVAALRIGAQLGLPVVVTARGTDLNVLCSMPVVRRQLLPLVKGAHALLAVSEELRRRFVAAADVADDRVRLARNGVDLERFHPGDPPAARRALGLPATGRLVLGVGRLVHSKGFHRVARAVADLPLDLSASLVLLGDGPERDSLRRLLPADRLFLLGNRPPDQVALAYQAADVLALATDREGWPNVVTEALASGLPVVAHAVGGIPEILTDPAFGRMVAPGDHRGLLAALHFFLRERPDPGLVHEFARRYAWDVTITQLASLFEAAVLAPRPR